MEAGRVIAQSIRLSRPLGAGGMGSVWLADHLALETEVVVKFMHQNLGEDPQNRDRFSREAVAASRVKSPHVVQTFDHGVTPEGIPFIVMEKLEGEDLARRIEKGPLSPGELSSVLTQVCKALTRAHGAGVVHRDIKPDNIFLCDVGTEEPFVKLLDFGIAKTALNPKLDNKTRTGAMMGTPYYMSPEQFAGAKEIDFRTDLWSLGVVAYESLLGVRPFDADTIGGLAIAVHSGDLPMPSSRRPELHTFDAWFAKACCRQPAGRHQSAREFAESFVAAAVSSPGGAALPKVSFSTTDPGAEAGPLSTTAAATVPVEQAPAAAGASLLMTTGASSAVEAALSPAGVPTRKSRAPLLAAAGLLAVIAIGGVTALTRHSPDAPPASPAAMAPPKDEPSPATQPVQAAAAAPAPAPVHLTDLPSASSSPQPAPAEGAVAAPGAPGAAHVAAKTPAAAPAASTHTAPAPAPAHPAAPAAAKGPVNCSPPFTIDGAGVKHPKPECL